MHPFLTDLRLAARRLRGEPAFVLAAVLVLALGIGATTSVVAVARAIVVQPFPFAGADRVVTLTGQMRREQVEDWPVGVLDLQDLRGQATGLEGPAAVTGARSFNLSAGEVVVHVSGELVSWDYFSSLGVAPARGRSFTEAEDAEGAAVALISDRLWRSDFGADPAVVGRLLELNDFSYEVIGVLPAGFTGLSDEADLWLPVGVAGRMYHPGYTTVRPFRWLSGVARLADGVPVEVAQRRVDAAMERLEAQYPADNEGFRLQVATLHDTFFGDTRTPLVILLGSAVFVLLIGAANLSNLLLVRSVARRRTLSIQRALGAPTGVVVRETVAEIVLIAVAGAGAGVLLAFAAVAAVARSGATGLPSYVRPEVDLAVASLGLLVSLVFALVAGLVPVIANERVEPAEVMKESATAAGVSARRRRVQGGLIALETATAVLLLVATGLMVRGLTGFLSQDLGFSTERLATLRVDLTGERFAEDEPVRALADALLDRGASIPGVEGIALEGPGYPGWGSFGIHLYPTDGPRAGGEDVMGLRHHVTPGYFRTLEIPLLAGRVFGPEDAAGAPPAVILSESMAAQLWPGESAVGRVLRSASDSTLLLSVVGVVADVSHQGRSVEERMAPDLYLPLHQYPPRNPPLVTLLVRTAGDAGAMIPTLRRELGAVTGDLPIFDVDEMEAVLAGQTAASRLIIRVMLGFALIATILAAIGIAGVVAFATRQRRREIGIRLALGASVGSVVLGTVLRALVPVSIGLAAGLIALPGLQGLIRSQLYGASPTAPGVIAGMSAVLLLVGAAASLLPAWRSSRLDPARVLRAE